MDYLQQAKKLQACVEVAENNSACVVLKVKDGKEAELIGLGCFYGDETMLRLTKGDHITCTVWRRGVKPYSWSWGLGGYTLVCDEMKTAGRIIQSCIQDCLRIPCSKYSH